MLLDAIKIPGKRAAELREIYRKSLFEDIVPWWMRFSIDAEFGGFYSCLERDGHAYAGEKFMWMTGRQIWMLSHLYNRHERDEAWLAAAKNGAEFMLRHALADGGKMFFRLGRQGEPRAKSLSMYTESFAAIGFAELARAADDESLWERAIEMYERIRPRLGAPEDTALLGYPLNARFHLHSHDMMRITLAWVFNEIRPDGRWDGDMAFSVKSILDRHWKPDIGLLLETVSPEGETLLDLPEGRMVHPGHSIESAWMLMEIAIRTKDDGLMRTAIDITMGSLEFGWDAEFGGLRYLRNLDGTPTHPLEADLKLWWPHGESLYALLLAWAYTGDAKIGEWYEKVHEYTFSHFPDPEYGEWFGYLNRDGSPVFTAKANGWKGFFHVPRVLFRAHELLQGTAGA